MCWLFVDFVLVVYWLYVCSLCVHCVFVVCWLCVGSMFDTCWLYVSCDSVNIPAAYFAAVYCFEVSRELTVAL